MLQLLLKYIMYLKYFIHQVKNVLLETCHIIKNILNSPL